MTQRNPKVAQYTIRGANGVEFDLSYGNDVQMSGPGLVGVQEYVPATVRRRRSATGYGQTRGKSRYEATTGSLTITMNPNDHAGRDLATISREWWSVWSYDAPAVLTIYTPGGWEPVSIELYLAGEKPVDDDLDPGIVGSFETTVLVEADDPLWAGPERELIRVQKTGRRGLFPGFPLRLTSGYARGRRRVLNVGPLPMWPVWTIVGPVSSWEITIGTATLSGSTEILDGQVLTVDARPGAKAARLDDGGGFITNVTDSLDLWGFAPIPPGEAEIVIQFSGAGTISGVGRTQYPRRW